MRKLNRFATVLIACLLSLSILPSARGTLAHDAATPGVTDSTIMVGTSLPLSGPAGAYGVIAGGIQAYFNYVNAHGGVNGRKLSLTVLDGSSRSRTSTLICAPLYCRTATSSLKIRSLSASERWQADA